MWNTQRLERGLHGCSVLFLSCFSPWQDYTIGRQWSKDDEGHVEQTWTQPGAWNQAQQSPADRWGSKKWMLVLRAVEVVCLFVRERSWLVQKLTYGCLPPKKIWLPTLSLHSGRHQLTSTSHPHRASKSTNYCTTFKYERIARITGHWRKRTQRKQGNAESGAKHFLKALINVLEEMRKYYIYKPRSRTGCYCDMEKKNWEIQRIIKSS